MVLLSFLGRESGGLETGYKGERWSEVLGSHTGLPQTSSVSWIYFVKERGRLNNLSFLLVLKFCDPLTRAFVSSGLVKGFVKGEARAKGSFRIGFGKPRGGSAW